MFETYTFLQKRLCLRLCRKLRQRDPSKFHVQLCISLFCMLLVFASGIDRTGNKGACVFVSVLIHYFTLTSVLWMWAEGILLFQLLVVVFVRLTTRYIVCFSLICWCK